MKIVPVALSGLLASSAHARPSPPNTCEVSYSGNDSGICESLDPELKKNCEKSSVLRAEVTPSDGGSCPGDGVTGKISDVLGTVFATEVAGAGLGFDPDQEVFGMVGGDIECYSTYETPEGGIVAFFAGSLSRYKVCWKNSTNFIDGENYQGCAYDCSQFDSFYYGVRKNVDGTIQHTRWEGWNSECPENPANPPLRPCQAQGPVCTAIGLPHFRASISQFFDAGNQNSAKFTCDVDSAGPSLGSTPPEGACTGLSKKRCIKNQLECDWTGSACQEKDDTSSGQEKEGSWLPHLPWHDLESSLSDPNSLNDAGPEKYIEECVENPVWEVPSSDRASWFLIDEPSGVCLPHLYCGLEDCDPKPDADNDRVIDRLRSIPETWTANAANASLQYSDLPLRYKNWLEDPTNPRYDIPPKVIQPLVASDVVKAVNFAREHGLKLSVKNSGHSYTASSMKSNTLLLNIRQYMTELLDITSCDGNAEDYDLGDDLSGQPCKLAAERGKPGFVRVSGGRNWAEVYVAVQEENRSLPAKKYLAIGGAAATVSPQGWTWQGGLAGTTMGRANGFGADQVLQIEMVLANGWHVKFGPTDWEPNDPYVPRTTKVDGKCNTKATTGDEPNWQDCPEEFPFNDLWKAICGGGGGWGVVLSSYIQLSDYEPLEVVELITQLSPSATSCPAPTTPEQDEAIIFLYQKFLLQFSLDPESVNTTQTQSNACGTPLSDGTYFCYGEESGRDFIDKWVEYFDENQALLAEAGVTEEVMFSIKNCNTVSSYQDYAEWLQDTASVPGPNNGELVLQDPPPPNFLEGNYMTMNIVTPKEWIIENLDVAAELFPSAYMAFGGSGNELADDQLNAIPDSYRNGGNMQFPWVSEDFVCRFGPNFDPSQGVTKGLGFPLAANDTWFGDYFPDMFDITDKTNFPSFFGSNHYNTYMKGPLKTDWTKACPLEWTRERRDKESVWGTKLLRELEEIKIAVDPHGMFTCNDCICDDKDCKKDVADFAPSGACVGYSKKTCIKSGCDWDGEVCQDKANALSLKGQVNHEDEIDFKSGGSAAKTSSGVVTMMVMWSLLN